MRVSVDALWFHIDVAIEPRDRFIDTQAARNLAVWLRARLRLLTKAVGPRFSGDRLEDFGDHLLADVGLRPDELQRRRTQGDLYDLAYRSMAPL